MIPSKASKYIGDVLADYLVLIGFKRKAVLFSRPIEDVVHLIQLQGSSGNAVGAAKYTINVAVWVNSLAPKERASVSGSHWSQRLGFLCPEHSDLWWGAASEKSMRQTALDIVDRVENYAIPALAALPNARSLLALWRSGVSPGLTKLQADRYSKAVGESLSAAS
jgi:hypothetical protein